MKKKIKKIIAVDFQKTTMTTFLKNKTMKNKNITFSEIGLFLSCIVMVLAIIYIRIN